MIRLGLLVLAVAFAGLVEAQDLTYRLPAHLGVPAEAERVGEHHQRDDWLGRDKAYHVGATFGITLGAYVAYREGLGMEPEASVPFAALTAFGVGIAKEEADSRRARRPLYSWKDLAADALGAALGAALVSL
ncbi:MAG: hypothetical protein AAGI52_01410 [Bacteroidota bacterium]